MKNIYMVYHHKHVGQVLAENCSCEKPPNIEFRFQVREETNTCYKVKMYKTAISFPCSDSADDAFKMLSSKAIELIIDDVLNEDKDVTIHEHTETSKTH